VYTEFTLQAPIQVAGMNITIKVPIIMPFNTIYNSLLKPFNVVALTPSNTSMSYTDGASTVVLGIQTGFLVATTPFKDQIPPP